MYFREFVTCHYSPLLIITVKKKILSILKLGATSGILLPTHGHMGAFEVPQSIQGI